MTVTIAEPTVHELHNGHAVAYAGKEPLDGPAGYAIQFTDTTAVFVVGENISGYTFFRFGGMGQLCVGRKAAVQADTVQCGMHILSGVRVEWSEKSVVNVTEVRIDFDDGSYVEVAPRNYWAAVVRDEGFLRLTYCA